MIVQVPDTQTFGAAVVAGWSLTGGTETMIHTVVAKAAYDLVDTGTGARAMVASDDPARSEIQFADVGAPFDQVNEDDNTVVAFDVTWESDIALEKARADVVVLGHLANTGSVRVNGSVWLTRNTPPPPPPPALPPLPRPLPDQERNLFGFQPRAAATRRIDFSSPAPNNALPPEYVPVFNNFHRRGGGFGPEVPGPELPASALVEVFQTTDQSDTAYAFRLPDTPLVARYRAYCGHGLDEARHWRIGDIGPMRPDTLVVSPDDDTATIVWRAQWPADAEPDGTYRSVQILNGGP